MSATRLYCYMCTTDSHRCEGLLSAQSVKHDRDARERELAARHVERELRLQIERLQEDKKYNDQVNYC
jgi:hypothetical protein